MLEGVAVNLDRVLELGRELMDQHGLTRWDLRFDHAKRRAGQCRFSTRTISVSRHLMALYDDAQVRETLLHEIAHALAGHRHGHDTTWRAIAIRIGASGERLVAPHNPEPPAPWHGVCRDGHTATRFRRPTKPMSCSRCVPRFHLAYLFTWTFHGEHVPMGSQYPRELHALEESGRIDNVPPKTWQELEEIYR